MCSCKNDVKSAIYFLLHCFVYSNGHCMLVRSLLRENRRMILYWVPLFLFKTRGFCWHCCFYLNDITQSVSDHQMSLSIIWYNLSHHKLGWPEQDTLFSKDILFPICFSYFSWNGYRKWRWKCFTERFRINLHVAAVRGWKPEMRMETSGLKWPTKWSGGWWRRPTSKQDYTFWTEL